MQTIIETVVFHTPSVPCARARAGNHPQTGSDVTPGATAELIAQYAARGTAEYGLAGCARCTFYRDIAIIALVVAIVLPAGHSLEYRVDLGSGIARAAGNKNG